MSWDGQNTINSRVLKKARRPKDRHASISSHKTESVRKGWTLRLQDSIYLSQIMDGNSEKEEEPAVSEKYSMELLRGLTKHGIRSEFCDLTVIIDDNVEFKCHRIIFAAFSGFFRASLTSGMKEDLERKVDLKGISKETFSEIMECMYSGKNIISETTVFDIWHAANQLEILVLVKDCEEFARSKMSIDNCFAVYQTSKLLDSRDMITFSWAFILKEFESVRKSEDILALTRSEMKQLVESQNLNATTEDSVIETIFRWVASKPEENISTESPQDESVNTAKNSNTNSEIESTDKPEPFCLNSDQLQEHPSLLDEEKALGQLQHAQPRGQSVETSKRDDDDVGFPRTEYLHQLLAVSRLCLTSGQCLTEDVWMNQMVRTDQKALRIIEEAISYQLQKDRHNDFCPAFAIYRSSSQIENVILAIQKGTQTDYLVCRRQDGDWIYFAKGVIGAFTPFQAIRFDHNMYIATGNNTIMTTDTTSPSQWKVLPKLSACAVRPFLVTLGHFLYAIYKNEEMHYCVDMINIQDSRDGRTQTQWCTAGTLSTTDMEISCTTTVGNKIIFFGSKTGKDDTIVEWFDITTRCSSLFNDVSGPSSGMVTFRKGKEAFILQKSGALWRIRSCQTPPFIEIVYETLLWDFHRDLKGAVILRDELLIFGCSISSNKIDGKWELAVPGVFDRVRNISCNENYSCFMHAVVPKASLTPIN